MALTGAKKIQSRLGISVSKLRIFFMFKQISHQTGIILIGLIKSGIVGVLVAIITSIVIAGGDLEVVPAALLVMLFLFPAMFLYHLGCALKLKQHICNMLFFAGFLSLELFFCICIILAYVQQPSEWVEGIGFIVFFLYILTFAGILVYLAEVIFRNYRSIKELGKKGTLKEFDWGNISKNSQTILIGVVRSCIIAVVVVLVATTGPGLINFRFEPIFITKGLMYLTGLLPAIIIYHITYALNLKQGKSDVLYFVAFAVVEIFFLPSALNMNVPQYVTDPNYDLSYLPFYAMAVIALGCIAVYMAEVYFRNWVVLKNLQTNAASGISETYSYYPVRKSLFDLGKFAIVIVIFVIITGLISGFAKYREQQKYNQMQTFVRQIIDSAHNQTEFYKNNSEEQAIEKLNDSMGRLSGDFTITIGNYNFGLGGYGNCRIVFENGDVFFANVEYEKGKFLLWSFVPKPSPESQEEFLKVLKAEIADANKPESHK